jgi:Protein of unknown function (DUF3887)
MRQGFAGPQMSFATADRTTKDEENAVITSDNRKKLTSVAQAVAVAATSLALTACGSGANSGTTSSSSAASSPSVAQAQYGEDALHILDYVVKGDFDSATAIFDSTMQEKLTPQALGSAWDEYQQQFGKYESHGDPQDVPRGDLNVVNIPLTMATMPGEFRVTFHTNDATVAGLYFLKTGVPVP